MNLCLDLALVFISNQNRRVGIASFASIPPADVLPVVRVGGGDLRPLEAIESGCPPSAAGAGIELAAETRVSTTPAGADAIAARPDLGGAAPRWLDGPHRLHKCRPGSALDHG